MQVPELKSDLKRPGSHSVSDSAKKPQHMSPQALAEACGLEVPIKRTEMMAQLRKLKATATKEAAKPSHGLLPAPRAPCFGLATPLWRVFQVTPSTPVIGEGGKPEREIKCLINTCNNCFFEPIRSQSRRTCHLKTHGLTISQLQDLSPSELEAFLEQGQVPHRFEAGEEQEPDSNIPPSSKTAHPPTNTSTQQKLATILGCGSAFTPMQRSLHRQLTASYARNMCVCAGMPLPCATNGGLTAFLKDLARCTQARYEWTGPAKESVRRVIMNDFAEMWSRMWADCEKLCPLEGVLHHDEWADPWKRTWLGVLYSYLGPDFRFHSVMVGIVQPADFASEDQGTEKESSTLATTARSAWGTACSSKPGRRAVKELPHAAMSDNANAAIATSKKLPAIPFHCAPHCLQILVKRCCFELDSDNNLIPKAVATLEKVRAWAKAFNDGETLAHWRRKKLGGHKHGLQILS